jgi:hypothetical protein
MHAALDRWRSECEPGAEGWLGGTYGFTDDQMFLGVVRFESEELAMRNSARPEQTAWWNSVEPLFDGPVDFHNCRDVMLMMEGGSDQAGFVQIIRGKLDNRDQARMMIDRMSSMLHEARPEIIGATIAIEDDGTFTETVAFTDEAAARQGESQAMPVSGPMHDAMVRFDHLIHDVEYRDLHAPWFASRG